jgi:phosphonate transport system substrate-binding protein
MRSVNAESAKKTDDRHQSFDRLLSSWARPIRILALLVLAVGISFPFYKLIKATYIERTPLQFSPRQWVNLDEKDNSLSDATAKDVALNASFRVAIAPIVSPEKSIEMYQDFVGYLAKKLGRNPIPLYRQTYAETNDLVRYKQCDIAVVCTYPFIRGEKEFGMQALAIPRVRGETTYNSLILVPHSSQAKSLLDLRGKRFASADLMSTTGWLFPAMWLMQNREDPNRFFLEHVMSGSHDRSFKAVADGYVDGAAVDSLVYHLMTTEDPLLVDKVKILHKSPPFGIPPIVGHPDMDSDLRTEALSVLLNMHNDGQGRMILDRLQIDQFVIPEKHHFDALRQAVSKLEGWR